MKKYLLLIAIVFSTSIFAETNQIVNNQSVKQTSFVDVKKKTEIKRALVVELLQLVNAKQQSKEVLDSMIKMMPSDVRDTFKKALNADEMMELVIPVYEKYLTIDDLKSVIKFYKSPAGKKLLEAQPKIMKDSMIVMKVYAQKKLSAMK
jgi:hypothetical protein